MQWGSQEGGFNKPSGHRRCRRPRGAQGRDEKAAVRSGPKVAHWFQGAHGVVASHPLRMRKALGSNPSVSICARVMNASRASFTNRGLLLSWGATAGGVSLVGFAHIAQKPALWGRVLYRLVKCQYCLPAMQGPLNRRVGLPVRPPCSPAHALPHAHETSHIDAQPTARPCGAAHRRCGNNISFR